MSVLVGFHGGRAVVAQIVEVVTELESGPHYLVPGNGLAGMTGSATHERCEVRVDRTPDFIVLSIVADAVDEVVPLVLPRAVAILCWCPNNVILPNSLVLEHVDGCGVGPAGKLRGTLGTVNEGGKLAARLGDPAKTTKSLCAVGESVLHRVDIYVLPMIRAVWYTSAQTDD